MPENPIEQKIQSVALFPTELDLNPKRADVLKLIGNYQRAFALLHALVRDQETELEDHSVVVGGTEEGALLTATYGVGFRSYVAASGNGTGVSTKVVYRADDGFLQRFDILIENYAAEIQFDIGRIGGVGGTVILLPGFYSIPFVSRGIYVKNRTANVAAWNIAGYY